MCGKAMPFRNNPFILIGLRPQRSGDLRFEIASIGVNVVKIYLLIVSLLLTVTFCLPAFAQQSGPEKRTANENDSDDELRRAIESSGGSETGIIESLEGYLKKFPKSAHLEEIE